MLAVLGSGCVAAPEYEHTSNKHSSLKQVVETSVGSTMLMREDITYITRKQWVGYLNSSDG
jgi:hypothetical protein